MSTFSLEKLIDKVTNKYRLVVVAAKRARSLNEKIDFDIKSKFRKSTTIALEEVLTGKIKYEEPKKKSKK